MTIECMSGAPVPGRFVHGPRGDVDSAHAARDHRDEMLSATRRSIVLALVLVMSTSALRAQRAASNEEGPTPMEQALIEYACHVPGQARSSQDAYDACLTAALATLRSDFGRDLQRLA